jgi:beta-galactosidase
VRILHRSSHSSLLALLALSPLLPAPLAAQAGAPARPEVRTRYTINDGWKFLPDGLNFAWSPKVSDAGWETVSVPHTWNAHDPFDDVESYRRGIGWYRRTLALDDGLKGKRVFLYFEGANQRADVYVNGAYAGEHRGGYTAFAMDVTRFLKFDGKGNENLLAVQVDNRQDPFIAPLSVGFALYGGLYRDVWLVATDPVHLDVTDHASPGVFITTPGVSRESGPVAVRGTVVNDGTATRRLRVVNTVTDAAGARVAQGSSSLDVAAGARGEFRQDLPAIARPHLWSPDDPYLYTVTTEVYDGEALVDRVTNPLGFRWYHFDAQRGFFLNGEKLQLRGTNRHQDHQDLGSALANDLHRRDMEIIKEMGANFVRLAHYPQDPAVLEAADRLGLLIWEEIPVVNYITVAPQFTENTHDMLRDMIRQHHNHPSVILWGIMNEVFLWSPEGARIGRQNDTTYMREVRDFAAAENRLAHEEDPTRPTTMAIHGSADYDLSGVAEVTDVVGVNEYSGWYSGVFEGFGRGLDRRHAEHPDQPIFVSEYGAENDERVNSLEPERFDFSNSWLRMFHESYLRQIDARPWLAGTAVWNQFDFSQPETGGTLPYMNQKGLLTWDRRPKDVYYLYQANWSETPMVHVASHQWTERAGTGPASAAGRGPVPLSQPVDVYSNLPRVELFLDGRSLGAKTPDDIHKASWSVPFTPGEHLVEARGTEGGKTYSDQVTIRFTYHAPDLKSAALPFHSLGVNVGSKAQYADARNEVWLGDQPYAPGSYGYLGGEAKMFNKDLPIKRTEQVPLYFTYREGLTGYRFDVPDGDYEVQLLFAEPTAEAAGERVFDVAVNGVPVGQRLDLAARAGLGVAVPITVSARAAGGGGVVVSFRAVTGQPILNGIHLRKR